MKILYAICLLFVINSRICLASEFSEDIHTHINAVAESTHRLIDSLDTHHKAVTERVFALRSLGRIIDKACNDVLSRRDPPPSMTYSPTSSITLYHPPKPEWTIWDLENLNEDKENETLLIQSARHGSSKRIFQCLKGLDAEETYTKQSASVKILNAMGRFMMALCSINTEGFSKKHLSDTAHTLYATAKIECHKYLIVCKRIASYLTAMDGHGRTFIQTSMQGFKNPKPILSLLLGFSDQFDALYVDPTLDFDRSKSLTVGDIVLQTPDKEGMLPYQRTLQHFNIFRILFWHLTYYEKPWTHKASKNIVSEMIKLVQVIKILKRDS